MIEKPIIIKQNKITRRQMLTATATAVAATRINITQAAAKPDSKPPKPKPHFIYCLNTSTIRGQKLGIVKEAQIASKAGYTAIEPWMRSINDYQKTGGSLKDLKNRLNDLGLTIESAIDFPKWIVDDDTERAKGLEDAKKSMDTLAQLGAKRIAAPPSGATKVAGLDLLNAAYRYRALLELGDTMGVTPQVEVWGFSKNLHLLGQAMFVAIESGHPKACLLPDIYHVYKGGSSFQGLKLLSRRAIQVFHFNDYPADPPRATIADRDRIFPGDGIAPFHQIVPDLLRINNQCVLSLELFSPAYWKKDALDVARTGLIKMKTIIQKNTG